jgi:hypothetical protein
LASLAAGLIGHPFGLVERDKRETVVAGYRALRPANPGGDGLG